MDLIQHGLSLGARWNIRMKTFSFNSQFNFLNHFNLKTVCSSSCPFFIPISCQNHHKQPSISTLPSKPALATRKSHTPNNKLMLSKVKPKCQNPSEQLSSHLSKARYLIVGAVSVGVVLFLMGMDEQKAWALGPEGPLMEEFWDNVRRYALYALTVSTGALYTILLPIYELLKNPISALLVLIIIAGSIFIVSQVVSAMSLVERKYMFLICNGILAFLAKSTSSSSAASSQSESTTESHVDVEVIEEASSGEVVHEQADYQNGDLHEDDDEEVENSVDLAEDDQYKQEHGGDQDEDCEEEEEENLESDVGCNIKKEEGERGQIGEIATEELNKKIEEFIRKMKEEIRIEARHQLIAAV